MVELWVNLVTEQPILSRLNVLSCLSKFKEN